MLGLARPGSLLEPGQGGVPDARLVRGQAGHCPADATDILAGLQARQHIASKYACRDAAGVCMVCLKSPVTLTMPIGQAQALACANDQPSGLHVLQAARLTGPGASSALCSKGELCQSHINIKQASMQGPHIVGRPQDVAGLRGRGGSTVTQAKAPRFAGAGGSNAAPRVAAPEELARRAPKLHHLHPQRLPHDHILLLCQLVQRPAHRWALHKSNRRLLPRNALAPRPGYSGDKW